MQKYKICPACQTKNEPTLLECIVCEADLTRVKITDEESEQMHREDAAPASAQPAMVRLCDCGKKNPPNARKCSACGEDISDITPSPDTAPEAGPVQTVLSYTLSSLDGQYAYALTAGETIVGRENSMGDYLAARSYVSRAHAKFTLENGELYIENLSGTNYTFVNNQKIAAKTKLEDGDELGLGGTSTNGRRQNDAAYFLVRIVQCM